MATLTDAQTRPLFDQKWDLDVLQARYGEEILGKAVLNKSAMIEESGEVINITIKPRVSGGTVGTDGGFTAEQITLTNVQVNVNTWRYVAHTITDKQASQAIVNLKEELSKQFGTKLAEFSEIDLATLLLSLSGGNDGLVAGQGLGTPGSGGLTFLPDTVLAAIKQLRKRNIPLDDMTWVLSPECFYDGWLSKDLTVAAYATGESKSLLTTGKPAKMMIGGIPAYESTLLNGSSATDDSGTLLNAASGVNQTGTTACALIHREALAIAKQINMKSKFADTTPALQLANVAVTHYLYGVRVVRASHGALIFVKN